MMLNTKKNNKKYYIRTFGCQMNAADSERFATIIEGIGYLPTDRLTEADLIVLNSCSVRQKAEDRVIGQGKKILALKAHNPQMLAVLTGCMARRTWHGVTKTGSPIQMTQESREAQLKKQMPWLDLVIETKDFGKLPQRLGIKEAQDQLQEKPEFYLSYKPKAASTFQAFVPISTGCDHFCTFCIVPFARGGEICRNADAIISEVSGLVSKGYKDITLLGQTVNRWINPQYDLLLKKGMIANTRIPGLNEQLMSAAGNNDPCDFLQLLQRLDEIPGDWWLNFVSSHPNYLTRELISFLGKSRHFRPYLHFALQSGSNAILKRMNRRYTVEEFIAKAEEFKRIIPGVSMSTDIIVGFPGETAEQFRETAMVMERLQFDMAFLSEFSPRKGTAAGLLRDNISPAEKSRRKNYLNDEILAKSALKNNQKMLGTEQKVLIMSEMNGLYLGKTGNSKDVHIKSGKKLHVGEFLQVKILSCTSWALSGEPA